MKKLALATALILGLASPAFAAPVIGQPAPDFSGKDLEGKDFKLSDQKGKIVVLEWTNPECPYVHKQYDSGNMQKVQKESVTKGIVWVTINSGADGRQGNTTAEEAKKIATERNAAFSSEILDPTGEIGHLYEAKTTPHMFVIDKDGKLAYMGAIDDNPSPNPADAATAKNYVTAAIESLEAGKPVETTTTQSYGCAVKYGD